VHVLAWIVAGGVGMAAIAMVGSLTLLMEERTLGRLLLPLLAFAAGSLIGGAFFHVMPAAILEGMDPVAAFSWAALGFTTFLAGGSSSTSRRGYQAAMARPPHG
jgi:zinc and cadmium transporter